MNATDTFRTAPYFHNCAQAVANRYTSLYESPDIVSEYAPYVGGRAPGGLCGALYAAMQACPDHAEEIRTLFIEKCGADTCRAIKGEKGTPCTVCVQTGDELVARFQ